MGGRKTEHLKGNIEGLTLQLTDDNIKAIEEANDFDIGFPQNFLGGPTGVKNPNDVWLMGAAGLQQHFDISPKVLQIFESNEYTTNSLQPLGPTREE